jgi:hypothetical protein
VPLCIDAVQLTEGTDTIKVGKCLIEGVVDMGLLLGLLHSSSFGILEGHLNIRWDLAFGSSRGREGRGGRENKGITLVFRGCRGRGERKNGGITLATMLASRKLGASNPCTIIVYSEMVSYTRGSSVGQHLGHILNPHVINFIVCFHRPSPL